MPNRPRQNPDDVDRSPRAHPRRDRHAEVHAQASRPGDPPPRDATDPRRRGDGPAGRARGPQVRGHDEE